MKPHTIKTQRLQKHNQQLSLFTSYQTPNSYTKWLMHTQA